MSNFGNGAANKAKQVIKSLLVSIMHQKTLHAFGKKGLKPPFHGMLKTYRLKKVWNGCLFKK